MRTYRNGDQHRIIGNQTEEAAQRWLTAQGMTTVARNFQCRTGEIDLIMLERGTLVFVEVRYRKSSAFGAGAETVNWHKQKKLLRTAEYFLMANARFRHYPCRFDVLSLEGQLTRLTYNWIKNAFC